MANSKEKTHQVCLKLITLFSMFLCTMAKTLFFLDLCRKNSLGTSSIQTSGPQAVLEASSYTIDYWTRRNYKRITVKYKTATCHWAKSISMHFIFARKWNSNTLPPLPFSLAQRIFCHSSVSAGTSLH